MPSVPAAPALGDLGRFAEAVASFDQAIALTPQCVEAHNYRGMALQRAATLGRGARELRARAVAAAGLCGAAQQPRQRTAPPATLRRGARELRAGDRPAAEPRRRPITIADWCCRRSEGTAEAASSYQRALALQPEFAEAYNNLGTVQCELGQPAEALTSCSRALQLQPGMPGVHGNLGNALRDLERPEEALAQYDLALREAPQDAR